MKHQTTLIAAALLLLGRVSEASPLRDYATANTTLCKCLPDEPCWPGPAAWSRFNESINGNLIATVPLGSPCHEPSYDEEHCSLLESLWSYAPVQ